MIIESVPMNRTCEETTSMIGDRYLYCGATAVALVQHIGRNEGPYFMCPACADHNIRNRHAKAVLVKLERSAQTDELHARWSSPR